MKTAKEFLEKEHYKPPTMAINGKGLIYKETVIELMERYAYQYHQAKVKENELLHSVSVSFNKQAEENLKKRNTIDFSKECEMCKNIIDKSNSR